ncbi:MAG: pilus assembly FimT family protein [Planctomycetota bacterium]|jgi:Tfp pilus assembly protein FimT
MADRRALERGISLAEVVLVAAIGLTLFAMAVPAAQNDDTAGAVARNIVADSVRARSYARRSWESVTVQMDVNNERWRALKQDGTALINNGADENGWHQAPVGVDFREILDQPTDLMFLPNGRASVSTSVEIWVGNTGWRLSVDALSARITAQPIAGR